MRLLLDQDVYAVTIGFLRSLGHDVVLVADINLSTARDADLLVVAREQGRILVTRDRDFGNLVFANDLGAGVIYLRIVPSTRHVVHAELQLVLEKYSGTELRQAFVVVEPGRHRFRRRPQGTN